MATASLLKDKQLMIFTFHQQPINLYKSINKVKI